MIKIENETTYGWESAIRGMRNPMNSWDKSDSAFVITKGEANGVTTPFLTGFSIGEKDLDLMRRLRNGGPDDRKYLRQIFVSMDITAPHYWWPEMDQYKVGTVTNSCSKMHKIASKPFELDDFSHDKMSVKSIEHLEKTIELLNDYREQYNKEQDSPAMKKHYWYQLIQELPICYNQKRTWTANYEVLCNIYNARKNHKLDEWKVFCERIKTLPYARELITCE